MTKSELKQMIREMLKEELSLKANASKSINEDLEDTKVLRSHTIDENIRVASEDVALARKIDFKANSIWHKGERGNKGEKYWCNKYGILDWSGIELFDKLAEEAGLTYEVVEDEY